MIFANVTDITIPEGNVIKIHETDSGRVLWEKKNTEIHPVWHIADIKLAFGSAGNKGSIRCISRNEDSSRSRFSLCSVNLTSDTCDAWGFWGDLSRSNDTTYLTYYPGGMFTQNAYSVLALTEVFSPSGSHGVVYAHHLNSDSYFFQRGANAYNSLNLSDSFSLKTLGPQSKDSVRITFSPERHEYLVTGLSNGRSCILPDDFTSSSLFIYRSGTPYSNFKNTHWVSAFNSYYAASGDDKNVYSSTDGLIWSDFNASSKGNVFDILFLAKQKKLCAVSNNQISLSEDGITWSYIDVPFYNAIVAAYSHDSGHLCVADSRNAYLTHDFVNWVEANLPLNRSVNFGSLLYLHEGIFVAADPLESAPNGEIYLLSLEMPSPLTINSNYLIA